ncbi:ABC transporter permease [Legionella birminghamensis]|uniref:ABC transporter permease n=1 Tax=Legionella birminghamensis TaxID=28083 RepID=A0A378I6J0_9GAMM|nr:ABC transporter permease [Legionella birminghamensis]KTC76019.1 ABC transporter permease [Legionella birminghamensis]STX30818.1 putative ABC transport system permease [Legionella birminghamensis]
MTKILSDAGLKYDAQNRCYACTGSWTVSSLNGFIETVQQEQLPETESLTISGKQLEHFDSAGALALHNFMRFLAEHKKETKLDDFNSQQLALLDLIKEKKEALDFQVPPAKPQPVLEMIGQETIHKINQADGFIILLGDLSTKFFEAFGQWRRFQIPSIISIIDSAGIKALPIVALLSFLIGVVLAYQMGLQLQTYGANIFIAYLSGMAIFREFAPLITAIIVAGRTSSAFTAQIGSMKINEEIDALYTMGLSPTELLVMPKVIGLLAVFPLLIFWSDVFSIFGAMFMSKWMLGISHVDYLARLKDSVGLTQLMLGLYKAPAFAFLIALVGCFQGFQVESSADSVGSQTTKSVVQALFLIIIADAVFSVVYSWMDL